jgi:kynurenine formamidase
MTMTREEQAKWYQALSVKTIARFGRHDRWGTANLMDEAARARGADCLSTGHSTSIARMVQAGDDWKPGVPGFRLEVSVNQYPESWVASHSARDRIEMVCHGRRNTHIDALNHVSLDGNWYSQWEIEDDHGPSISDWAARGFFTRAVYLNVSAARQTDWVDASAPVTGQEMEDALRTAGISFSSGDALLLDMGRDRFEAAGHDLIRQFGSPDDHKQPGVGVSGAEWIADHGVSALCWDFMDAIHPSEPGFAVHSLIWAIGQVLVDNCDFATLRSEFEAGAGAVARTTALVLAPLPIPRGTGSSINPLVIV